MSLDKFTAPPPFPSLLPLIPQFSEIQYLRRKEKQINILLREMSRFLNAPY